MNVPYKLTDQTQPTIGMGATIAFVSDCYPATVIAVSKSGKRITLQDDQAVRTDRNGISESQTYEITRDPNGGTQNASLRKDGKWRTTGGQRVILGSRRQYRDPSF